MIRFLLATLFYRLANGLLFLSVAWNLVRSADGGAMFLAISSVAGFFPALLIAPFAKRLLNDFDSRKLTVVGISALLLLSLAFVPFLDAPKAVLIVNFAVLLVFFLLEGTWESLLATIAAQLPQSQADALNARQSTATQSGLMLVGLPLGALTRLGGPELSFFVAALLYMIAIALLVLVLVPVLTRRLAAPEKDAPTYTVPDLIGTPRTVAEAAPRSAFMMLALLWPCLTLVNMALPLLSNANGASADHVAALDAAIGLGMAVAGLVWGNYCRLSERRQQMAMAASAAALPLPFVVLQLAGYAFWPLAASFFVCGVGCSLFRISVRKHLIATRTPQDVGRIVFSCNAFGFPVLIAVAFLYALTWRQGAAVPLVAFAVFGLAGLKAMRGQSPPPRAATAWQDPK